MRERLAGVSGVTAAEGSEGTSALEVLRDSITEAATRARGLWLGYIALMTYLAISIGAVTHRDLLFESPVRLPVLNVDLPLLGFFAVAPLFFLINHFYLLLILFGLSKRIQRFNAAVNEARLPTDAEDLERWRLPSFVIVQMLAGVKEDRTWGSLSGFFLWMIAWITLVVLPVGLILGFQLQFLPYHHQGITWLHRIILALDLAALWLFWPAIRHGQWTRLRGSAWRWGTAVLLVPLSWGVLTFPGEVMDCGPRCHWTTYENSWLGEGKRAIFFALPIHRTLSLPDEQLIDLAEFDKIRTRHKTFDKDLEPWKMSRTLSLRERDLKGANFDRSDLRNSDMHNAALQGASLEGSNLQGVLLERADLRGASLMNSNLKGASLERTRLQGANLSFTIIQDAYLFGGNFQGASLKNAALQGAITTGAQLQGASLDFSNLQGASLNFAKLQGASLESADLQGASLFAASLLGASLNNANLQGAHLRNADLQGASLDGTSLKGASLEYAHLQGATLFRTNVSNTTLSHTSLWRTMGSPQFDPTTPPWANDLDTDAIPQEELTRFVERSIDNIESRETIKKINESLKVLFLKSKDLTYEHSFLDPDATFPQIAVEKYTVNLKNYLVELACAPSGSPYVTKGLTSSNQPVANPMAKLDRDTILSFFRSTFARSILTAVETMDPACPGINGLDSVSLESLREWASQSPSIR